MADKDVADIPVILTEIKIISKALYIPAYATIQGTRKNMMTPRMVNVQGVKTPPNVPNLDPDVASSLDRENKNQFLLSVQCASKCLHFSDPMDHKSQLFDLSRSQLTPLDESPVSRSLRRNPLGESFAGNPLNTQSYIS